MPILEPPWPASSADIFSPYLACMAAEVGRAERSLLQRKKPLQIHAQKISSNPSAQATRLSWQPESESCFSKPVSISSCSASTLSCLPAWLIVPTQLIVKCGAKKRPQRPRPLPQTLNLQSLIQNTENPKCPNIEASVFTHTILGLLIRTLVSWAPKP